MKKLIVATLAVLATTTAFAGTAPTPKKATISIPDGAIPTAYTCDGKDIAYEKVQAITHNTDGTVTVKYKHKAKTKTATCTKEFVKAYG